MNRESGITLIELLVVTAILAVLAGIGIPMYSSAIERARVIKATRELEQIGRDIAAYQLQNFGNLPPTLADVGHGGRTDPWGTPYYYLNFTTGTGSGGGIQGGEQTESNSNTQDQQKQDNKGGFDLLTTSDSESEPNGSNKDLSKTLTGLKRKDKMLVPLNSDFDLYSAGPDRQTKPPLTAKASHDDILRANDGAYVGRAADY